jgi:hypothetical protein
MATPFAEISFLSNRSFRHCLLIINFLQINSRSASFILLSSKSISEFGSNVSTNSSILGLIGKTPAKRKKNMNRKQNYELTYMV